MPATAISSVTRRVAVARETGQSRALIGWELRRRGAGIVGARFRPLTQFQHEGVLLDVASALLTD